MKKLFFLLACVAMSVLSFGQDNQLVWANGRLLYGTPIESVDSLTYDEMQDIDTLHLLLPRTLIKVVHDTVYIHDTVYVETDCSGKDDTPSAGIGVFSVGEGKTVTFSKGNLQYHPANNEWRFAENQTDYIGDANSNISANYDGWIDLFGWGTGDNPINSSWSAEDYQTFIDWGTNKIGNDAPNTWRTLTDDEWYYLRYTRTNADALCGVAQVNGVNGLILLPDNWTCPAGVTFKSGFHNNYGVEYYAAYQTFTAAEWSKLEAAGAVFLPASGNRGGSNVNLVQNFGRYWSATENGSYNARSLYLDSFEAGLNFYDRYDGHSVRLVKDIEGGGATPDTPDTPTEPEEPTNPSAGIGVFSVFGKEVTFSKGNLQYHPANDEWRFAENQSDCIGNANSNIAADYDGWIDLFGWGTGDAPTKSSTSNSDYSTFVDWGTNQIGSDAPNTWRTLTYDEWYSLLYTRTNANDLCGVAQVNGVNGLILLPDNWTCPSGVSFKSGFHSEWGVEYYAAYQTFTAAEWSKLEAAGAVFLPAAGYRDGYYWSATGWYENISSFDVFGAYCLTFGSGGADVNLDDRYSGLSVRLVKDLQ